MSHGNVARFSPAGNFAKPRLAGEKPPSSWQTLALLRPEAQEYLPLPGCLSQKCIAQCRLALRQAQGERKTQIPFVLSLSKHDFAYRVDL